jgi:hypothetical protein
MKRFWEKVEKSDGCWIWTAGKNKDTGYGVHQSTVSRQIRQLAVS